MASSARSQINIDVYANVSSGTDAKPKVDYLPLYKAILRGDWDVASAFFDRYPDALEARIDPGLGTALHIAIAKTSRSGLCFVEKLIERMSPEALALTGTKGRTALDIAAANGNLKAAKLLVGKNRNLPLLRDWGDQSPLQKAARFGHRDMLEYLIGVTRDAGQLSPFVSETGVFIIRHIIFAGFYDLALELVQQYPELATFECKVADSPLDTMAAMPSAFPSGCNLKMWQRFIYFWIPIEACSNCLFDGATVSYRANGSRGQMQTGSLLHVLAEKCITPVLQMRDIRDLKIKHQQSLQLVKFLCKEAAKLDYKRAKSIMSGPLFYAAKNGIHEIVEEIVEAFPPAVRFIDDKHHNIFQISVLHRQENVFNLLYQMDQPTSLTTFKDKDENNILHLAGGLAPSHRLNQISGAALQMQRELQWFKEVEKFVPPVFKESKNGKKKTPAMVFTKAHKERVTKGEKWMKHTTNSFFKESKDGEIKKTPAMVFTEAHKGLVIEGEKWMKDTANSCSLVAALIAAVVFAAAITVPGGSDSATGYPMFRTRRAFTVFAIFDALSLFSSSASILMFLSILTARYDESDFLRALPKRLVIGL